MMKEGSWSRSGDCLQNWISVELAPHDFSRAQIVFRAKQPGRMEKF